MPKDLARFLGTPVGLDQFHVEFGIIMPAGVTGSYQRSTGNVSHAGRLEGRPEGCPSLSVHLSLMA